MFNADPKTLQKIQPRIERVLIIDPHAGWARLIGDLFKVLGTAHIVYGHPDNLTAQIAKSRPQLIVTELSGPDFDGLQFTRALRRGDPGVRVIPVIMVTGEATRTNILEARNAGVHEFLKKPFTAGDLSRRIEHVVLKPRAWIEAKGYVGPDRRRFNTGEAPRRRRREDKVQLIG